MKIERSGRKAISPIVATVLILAATLIAFAAVVGYIFGLFGTATNSANVAVTGTTIPASGTGSTALAAACSTTATSPDLVLTNTGTGSASVTGFSLTFGGKTFTASPSGGASCTLSGVGASSGSTIYIDITSGDTGAAGTAGNAFTGTVTLSNGEIAQFTGVFQ